MREKGYSEIEINSKTNPILSRDSKSYLMVSDCDSLAPFIHGGMSESDKSILRQKGFTKYTDFIEEHIKLLPMKKEVASANDI